MNAVVDMRRSPIWAILPVKRISSAKQRLGNVLSAAERQDLFRHMLTDVMVAIGHAKSLHGLVVVTGDPEVRALVKRHRARVFVTDSDDGQSAAVTAAATKLSGEGIRCIITLAVDMPLMTATDIDAVCNSLGGEPAITIVPNGDETGTNSIAVSPPCAIPFMFGELSFTRHLHAAGEQHIDTQVLRLPGMALDIDVVSDLVQLLSLEVSTATQSFLVSSGIARRLEQHGFAAEGSRPVTAGGRVT